jgi:hypothetical protein
MLQDWEQEKAPTRTDAFLEHPGSLNSVAAEVQDCGQKNLIVKLQIGMTTCGSAAAHGCESPAPWRCRTVRALGLLTCRYPGVPLRSTPGSMLPPATRALSKVRAHNLFRASGSRYDFERKVGH